MTSSAAPARKTPLTGGLPGVGRRSLRRHGVRSSDAMGGWLFSAPFLLVFLVFTAVPAVAALSFAFTDIRAADLRNPFGVDFVGIDTFVRVFQTPGFVRSILNTFLYVVIAVPTIMVVGFLLALVLDTGIRRLRTFFRAALYIPVITNIVAAGVIWQYAYTPNGPVNAALALVGIDGPTWLGEPGTAFFVVVLLGIWRNIGTAMVLFLAGLQAIPDDVTEASSLDGAGYWRRVRSIILPMLRPTTLLVSVLMTISFLNTFDEPYLVTGGGPLGSTQSIAQWVYTAFGNGGVADAMAASVVLLILVLLISVAQLRLLRPKH